jgi:hypothetical protein
VPVFSSLRARAQSYVSVTTFLRLLSFVYFTAFLSLGIQAQGLLGSTGILPVGNFLTAVRQTVGHAAWREVPTILWWNSSDTALHASWIAGVVLSIGAAIGFRQRLLLAGCFVLWLSLCAAGQEFLSYQWDVLLLEAGFLAVFADASPARVWLFRWLLFRLMFSSGLVKFVSGDPTWRNFTALSYHYETQPLPTPLAWYMQQLPAVVQKVSTGFVFFTELVVPFLFLGPRNVRRVAGWITIALQILILLTGNYTFFNILTIFLCIWLYIDSEPGLHPKPHRIVSAGLSGWIAFASIMLFVEMIAGGMPPGGAEVMRAIEPLRIVNSYGLFAVMTTTRNEIIVEGSDDDVNWRAYEFKYKPGDPNRAPPIVAPYQPRLDWQMWFAALGTYRENRWFTNLIFRLLQGQPSVLRLMRYNPFPNSPPKHIRARVYVYHFTRWGQKGWWTREERGTYLPDVSLK